MSDAAATSSPPKPEATPSATAAVPVPPRARASGLLWLLALGGLACGAGALALTWRNLDHLRVLEQQLVKRQQDSQTEAADARLNAKQAQELARETAAKAALIEARVSELAAQREQVAELLQSLSRSRDENLLADVEAALQVAQQQAALTGSAEPVVAALRTADERLERAKQARFEPLRRAIARDLDTLRNSAHADIALLTQRLDEAIALVDDLPLRNAAPVPASGGARKPAAAVVGSASAPAAKASAPAEPASWTGRVAEWLAPAWDDARTLVRVTRIDHPEAILIAPEQAYFLRENLKLKLLNARLSLLARQPRLLQTDLQDAQDALGRYFDPASRKAAQLVALLQQVGTQGRQMSVPRPEQSLALLQTAVSTAVSRVR